MIFTLTGRLERSLFKLIDGCTAVASWLGYAIGSNRASRRQRRSEPQGSRAV
jgi:hypothetical protein